MMDAVPIRMNGNLVTVVPQSGAGGYEQSDIVTVAEIAGVKRGPRLGFNGLFEIEGWPVPNHSRIARGSTEIRGNLHDLVPLQ